MGLFSLARRNTRDPMRESAAMTTVYLLEWNRKFEQFLRAKISDLEARVAAQQARLSTQAATVAREVWADELPLLDDLGGEPVATNHGPPTNAVENPPVSPAEEPVDFASPPIDSAPSDYLSLLAGAPATPDPTTDEWDTVDLLAAGANEFEASAANGMTNPAPPGEAIPDSWPDAAPENDAWADLD